MQEWFLLVLRKKRLIMYKYGKASLANINSCELMVIRLCHGAMRRMNSLHDDIKVDFSIVSGKREADEQLKRWLIGRELIAGTYQVTGETVTNCDGYDNLSTHQSGLAIDFAAWVNGKSSYDYKYMAIIASCFFAAAAELGIKITWGGHWKDPLDMGHIQVELEC